MKKKMRKLSNLQKAKDLAIWLSFKHRVEGKIFGVVPSIDKGYIVTDINHPTFKGEDFETLPKDYSNMTYKDIRHIGMDENPLAHWEEIKGTFAVMHGEHLRFILAYKVSLEKFIRNELANRGHDENHKWVSFEKAEEIWLK